MTLTLDPVRVRAHGRSVRHLGDWTTARRFDVRASRSSVVLDLLLPELEPGDIELELDPDHSMVKLLVPDGAPDSSLITRQAVPPGSTVNSGTEVAVSTVEPSL